VQEGGEAKYSRAVAAHRWMPKPGAVHEGKRRSEIRLMNGGFQEGKWPKDEAELVGFRGALFGVVRCTVQVFRDRGPLNLGPAIRSQAGNR